MNAFFAFPWRHIPALVLVVLGGAMLVQASFGGATSSGRPAEGPGSRQPITAILGHTPARVLCSRRT
jgi:hypothetical protein